MLTLRIGPAVTCFRTRVVFLFATAIALSALVSISLQAREYTINPERIEAMARENASDVLRKDLEPAIDAAFVAIPGGSFQMGCLSIDSDCASHEKPVHTVNVTSFWLMKTEVTQHQWRSVMGKQSSSRKGFDGSDEPAESISWNEAQEFIDKLNVKTGKTYRLPTEAEWEYSARAGSTTKYSWGNTPSGRHANGYEKEGWPTDGYSKTAPVASLMANDWGLYDMHGNVWEWVEDCWNDSYLGAPSNGSAWLAGDCGSRVLRGGSRFHYPQDLRSARRSAYPRHNRFDFRTGFRLARDLK